MTILTRAEIAWYTYTTPDIICGKYQKNKVETEGVVYVLTYLANFATLKGHNSAMTKMTRAKIVSYTPAIPGSYLQQVSNKSVRN